MINKQWNSQSSSSKNNTQRMASHFSSWTVSFYKTFVIYLNIILIALWKKWTPRWLRNIVPWYLVNRSPVSICWMNEWFLNNVLHLTTWQLCITTTFTAHSDPQSSGPPELSWKLSHLGKEFIKFSSSLVPPAQHWGLTFGDSLHYCDWCLRLIEFPHSFLILCFC